MLWWWSQVRVRQLFRSRDPGSETTVVLQVCIRNSRTAVETSLRIPLAPPASRIPPPTMCAARLAALEVENADVHSAASEADAILEHPASENAGLKPSLAAAKQRDRALLSAEHRARALLSATQTSSALAAALAHWPVADAARMLAAPLAAAAAGPPLAVAGALEAAAAFRRVGWAGCRAETVARLGEEGGGRGGWVRRRICGWLASLCGVSGMYWRRRRRVLARAGGWLQAVSVHVAAVRAAMGRAQANVEDMQVCCAAF